MAEQLLLQAAKAFLVGGLICLLGQIMFDAFNLTPAHTMSVLVVSGAILSGLGWYEKLVDWAGFGAKLPISSFGNSLTEGAVNGAVTEGFWGIFMGMMKPVSAGVAAAVVFGFIIALVFKPKA